MFGSIFTTFELSSFLEAAGAVLKIGLSLKSNHHQEIKLAQICEMLCSSNISGTYRMCHGFRLTTRVAYFFC
jgi:hypothetical protein